MSKKVRVYFAAQGFVEIPLQSEFQDDSGRRVTDLDSAIDAFLESPVIYLAESEERYFQIDEIWDIDANR